MKYFLVIGVLSESSRVAAASKPAETRTSEPTAALPARGYSGTPLGGKGLAVLDLRTGLMIAFDAHPDGETNDALLIPGLLPQV
ncbi:MAG: hypothetical protein AB7U20_04275, partial [Planctomycetaceae bacterium]